jgi:glycosyltransferase involved in cell wall biosynthesis
MKIAYVYDVIYPETVGGVEKRIYEIGIRLSRMGHEVHLFGMKYWDGPQVIHRDGLILHGVCPVMGLYVEGRRSVFQAIWYTISLIPHLLRSDVDIIDCQNFPYFPAIACYFISRLKKKPVVYTWHEFWGKYWLSYLGISGIIGLFIEHLALWCSSDAIAVSLLTASYMKNAGFHSDVKIIPNGMDARQIKDISPSSVMSDLIFVGRFIPEKHPELVVEAFRLLLPDFPALHGIMIGDGPRFQSVLDLVQSYGLSGRIDCTGFVSDHKEVISLMKSSKVFVLPSEREGFGIAALEALACGLSLVTIVHPRNAAAVHVLPQAGYLARMDAADIARGIVECLENSPDPEIINRYVAVHDWDAISEATGNFYREIV